MAAKTELGTFIEQHRKRQGLKLGAFQAKLEAAMAQTAGPGAKISSGYLSKIESGVIRSPDDQFLMLLAAETGRSVVELREMCRPASEAVGKIRVACGHSIWNAPIVCAASEGLLPDLQVATFLRDEGDLAADRLVWVSGPAKAGDAPAVERQAVPLSAADVLYLLRHNQVDIGALPGNLVRGTRLEREFVCVGTIVDSAVGCSLVYGDTLEDFGPRTTTDRLGAALAKRAAGKKGLAFRIAGEEGTIAAEYLRQASLHGWPKAVEPASVMWHCRAADLREKSFTELSEGCLADTGCELAGVVAWQPHTTWLLTNSAPVKQAKRSAALRTTALQFSPNPNTNREPRLTYEVVIKADRVGDPPTRRQELYHALFRLMERANDLAERLNRVDEEPETVIRRLAAFYGFTTATAAGHPGGVIGQTKQAFGQGLYSVRWNVVPGMRIGPQV